MEANMLKRILLGIAATALALFAVSCVDVKYEAYVTVVNIGNLPMNAWVEGDGAEIAAYDSQTWAVSLETEDEVRAVLLEAEPFGGGDHDQVTINLHGDRDVQTWLTGWDSGAGAAPLKKQSRVIPGPAPSPVTRNK
jgi:hypothetical protein